MGFDASLIMSYAQTLLAMFAPITNWILGLGAAAFVFTLIIGFMKRH